MSDKFALHLPFNSTSLGQLSFGIAKEIFKRGLNPCIFPIGQVDGSTQLPDEEFTNWLVSNINRGIKDFKKDWPVFKCWHLDGSLESFSNRQILLSFWETSDPTPYEINIAKNSEKVLFTSHYPVERFKEFGASNVDFLPLFFDSYHFKEQDINYTDNRISFTLCGKLEWLRKRHLKTLKTWVDNFANQSEFFLNCALQNPFLPAETQQNAIAQTFGGNKPWNVNFVPWMASNIQYNAFLNSGDIMLAMSGSENWDLPAFHAVAMGKHCVAHNISGVAEWANDKNSSLVYPSGRIDAHDNIFFVKGRPFNQGQMWDWSEEDFVEGCKNAIARVRKNRVNKEGLKLKKQFTVQKTVDQIIKHLGI